MSEQQDVLTRAARQLIAIEELLGGTYLPAGRGELPKMPDLPDLPTAAAAPAVEELAPAAKAKALAAIQGEVEACRKCPLCRSRTRTVFGECNPNADLVFVGEAPGHDEDVSGRPFVGRAGKLLTKMITAMGLTREDVFICNVLKCRPPNNRTPTPDEAAACWDYLIRQLQVIRPKVIVTLGNPATKTLLRTQVGITRMRGTWNELPDHGDRLAGIPVMPTFHPSYVLRQYTADIRGKAWSDLQAVMAHLHLPLPKR